MELVSEMKTLSNNQLPLVSIVVPIYNMDCAIERCVKSLLKQDYDNYEIILVDDGSKDDSYKKCCAIASVEKKVRCIHTENRGSGPARNIGILQSRGRYIYFPDADDELDSHAISLLVNSIASDDYDLVVFGFQSVKKDGSVVYRKEYFNSIQSGDEVRKNYSEYLIMNAKWGIQGAPWNKFFDLNLIREHNIKFPSLRRHQDECFISLYMCYVKKIRFIDAVLYTYYINSLTDEWRKYPLDYFENVRQLYDYRKKTILMWNTHDEKTHDLVKKEYVCGTIKSFELFFSPKYNLSVVERYKKILNCVNQSELMALKRPKSLPKYHTWVLWTIQKKAWMLCYVLMFAKVIVQKMVK